MGKTGAGSGWYVVRQGGNEAEELTVKQGKDEAEEFTAKREEKNSVRKRSMRQQTERNSGQDKRMARQPVQDSERLEVLRRICLLEQEGKFDIDAEDDPPTIPLRPDKIDYLRTKPISRLKSKAAYTAADWFVHSLIRQKKLVIRQVLGMENLNAVESGAVLTCNHFHPYDCLTVEYLFRHSAHRRKKQLFKVIREGNYTNFPGFYGLLFRNCNTLPLSQTKETMCRFLKAVDTILTRGDFILIYPEQSMWWNYRKPKPLKNGAYKFAVKNHVPVVPLFIAMEDSGRIGEDGFPVQEYTVFIKEPIYPPADLAVREQVQAMKDKNAGIWKQIYEEFYRRPLVYSVSRDYV